MKTIATIDKIISSSLVLAVLKVDEEQVKKGAVYTVVAPSELPDGTTIYLPKGSLRAYQSQPGRLYLFESFVESRIPYSGLAGQGLAGKGGLAEYFRERASLVPQIEVRSARLDSSDKLEAISSKVVPGDLIVE